MGIDGFNAWIDKDYPEAYSNIVTSKTLYHHLYIDLNYLLHLCHYNSNDTVHLLNKMSMIILDICVKVQPIKSVNLYCDGTAPFAKMVIQRERRCKNIKISDDIFKTSLNFTSGTQFIEELPKKLEKTIKIIKNLFHIEVNIDTIIDGEAEIKIKGKVLENNNKNNNKQNNVLVTNDADVVLISSSSDTYKNTYILVKDKLLSIDKLLNLHFKKYSSPIELDYTVNNMDFVLLNLFLGDDYIPKIGYISPNKLWNAYKLNISKYKKLIEYDNNKFNINKDFLLDILDDCISSIGKTKIIKNNKIYNKEKLDNYFEGILWIINMYNNGKCNNFEYICNDLQPIDIFNFRMYIQSLTNINNYNNKIVESIPSTLCGILLLPKEAQQLISNRYKDFMDDEEIKIIYNDKFKITINFLKSITKKYNKYNTEIKQI